jgi:hypothetical protein
LCARLRNRGNRGRVDKAHGAVSERRSMTTCRAGSTHRCLCGQAQAHGKRKLHPSCMACHGGIGAKTRKPTASRAGAVPGKGRAPPAITACRRTTAKIGKRPKRLKRKGTTYPYAGTPSWWLKTSKQTTDSITMVHVCVDKSRRAIVHNPLEAE